MLREQISGSIVDVPGIMVGHAHDLEGLTGCTVVMCEAGAAGGVDQRGGAPGTRETDLLRPMHTVDQVHAVLLTGGSAFGLDAAAGVMAYLEERGVGYNTGTARVPIVPAAVIYDLDTGSDHARPTAQMGYQACENASASPPAEGNAGAGAGATVGKILGMGQAMKAGVGSASLRLGGGVVVGALAVVNAFGDVLDPDTGRVIAGARAPEGSVEPFADTRSVMLGLSRKAGFRFAPRMNTVLGVVATNARLSKEEANKNAQMAQDGLARSICPAHTMLDGDTIFALATGERSADVNIVGTFAAEVFARAVVRAALTAESAGGLPGAKNLSQG